jgi:hypothetical protein
MHYQVFVSDHHSGVIGMNLVSVLVYFSGPGHPTDTVVDVALEALQTRYTKRTFGEVYIQLFNWLRFDRLAMYIRCCI